MKLNVRNIVIVVILLLVLVNLRDIAALWHRLRIGDMIDETVDCIWSMPRMARYVMVLGLAGLLYATIFALINNRK